MPTRKTGDDDTKDHDVVFDALVENVPEVATGHVVVRGIARLNGIRTKVAVHTDEPGLDCVAACHGPDGRRIARICDEIGGEPVDIVRWSEDLATFVRHALEPALVDAVWVDSVANTATVTANPIQEPLAHGPHDENRLLASQLCGCRIAFED